MSAISPTAATPMPPLPRVGQDDRTPMQRVATGGGGESLRLRITGWMEAKLGRAAMPVAALAGGALGGTVGMLTLGPIGAAAGGLGGAFLGAVLFMAG